MSAAFKAAAKSSWRPSRVRSDFPPGPFSRTAGITAVANTTLRPHRTRRTRIALMNAQSAKDKARRSEHEGGSGLWSFAFLVLGALLFYQSGSKYALRQHLNDRKKEAADLRQAMEDLKAEMSVETGWFWRARTIVEDPEIEPIVSTFLGLPVRGPDQRSWLSRFLWKRPVDEPSPCTDARLANRPHARDSTVKGRTNPIGISVCDSC